MLDKKDCFAMVGATILTLVLFMVGYLGAAALEGLIVMKLWNWIAPSLFHNPPVLTWLKTTGIIIFLNIIFPIRYVNSKKGER